MNKTKLFIVLGLSILLLTGCTEKTESGTKVDSDSDMTNNNGTLVCTRTANGMNNSTVELNYEVSYKAGYITILHSNEKLVSDDKATLDTYEEAYKKIFDVYKDLDHYTNNIIRKDDYVESDTIIDYSKIDMEKLKILENTDDSVIKDGKVALSDWLKFAEKFGTKCTEK